MPSINRTGGLSARGFGFFSYTPPGGSGGGGGGGGSGGGGGGSGGGISDGTLALVFTGIGHSATFLYNYATAAVTAGPDSLSSSPTDTIDAYIGATSNSTVAIFKTTIHSNHSITTSKYTYSSGTMSFSNDGTIHASAYNGLAVGNATIGYFFHQLLTLYTIKYTYAGDISASGGTVYNYLHSVAGNATEAIFGNNGQTSFTKYLYSSDTSAVVSPFTPLNYCDGGHAFGNATVGIFGASATGTGAYSLTNKYNYSNDTVTAGITLSIDTYGTMGASGNSTTALISIVNNSGSFNLLYTYSNDTVAATTGPGSWTICSSATNGCAGVTI